MKKPIDRLYAERGKSSYSWMHRDGMGSFGGWLVIAFVGALIGVIMYAYQKVIAWMDWLGAWLPF